MPFINDNNETYKPLTGLVYLFNLMVGTGALTMPAAFSNAGWVASIVVVVILCVISYITTTFVIESMSLANALIKQRKHNSDKERQRTPPTDNHSEGQSPSNSLDNSCTEKLPLLDYNSHISDDQELDEDRELYYEITQKVELGAMADLFFNRIGVKLFYVTIAIYLFGDLAIYSAAISKSLRDVTCTYEHQNCSQTLTSSDQCWTGIQSVDRTNAYRIYLALTLVAVGPFAFFNLQKTKYLQILTTLFRWIAFISMTIAATIALIAGKGDGRPKAVAIKGIPNLFGVCVYSFMCHHSLPSLITPIKDKRRLFSFILTDYILILSFYSLLSFTGIFAFRQLEDIYTLNFQVQRCTNPDDSNPVPPIPVLDYFLPLFPVFTLSTNFPIIAITLQNNLKTLFSTPESLQTSSFFTKRLLYPLLAIIPPFVVSFATEDLEILVGVVGSYAGACIQYVFPALLVYYSRKKISSFCPNLVSTHTPMTSPFGHKLWIFLVLIWSVICIILVTTDHIIEFSK